MSSIKKARAILLLKPIHNYYYYNIEYAVCLFFNHASTYSKIQCHKLQIGLSRLRLKSNLCVRIGVSAIILYTNRFNSLFIIALTNNLKIYWTMDNSPVPESFCLRQQQLILNISLAQFNLSIRQIYYYCCSQHFIKDTVFNFSSGLKF